MADTDTARAIELLRQGTPGPWTATVSEQGGHLSVRAGDALVIGGCGCCDSPYMDEKHGKADARRIAAVPGLVEVFAAAVAHRARRSAKTQDALDAAIANLTKGVLGDG